MHFRGLLCSSCLHRESSQHLDGFVEPQILAKSSSSARLDRQNKPIRAAWYGSIMAVCVTSKRWSRCFQRQSSNSIPSKNTRLQESSSLQVPNQHILGCNVGCRVANLSFFSMCKSVVFPALSRPRNRILAFLLTRPGRTHRDMR